MGKKGKKSGVSSSESTATSATTASSATTSATITNSGKQEIISMANLEVVSEENFQRRLEGMSSGQGSCVHCIKERSKGDYHPGSSSHLPRENGHCEPAGKSRKRRRANKPRGVRIIPRASSPIVVHLEDSIKVSSGRNGKSSRDIGKSPLTVENNNVEITTSKTGRDSPSIATTAASESSETSSNKNNRSRGNGGSHGNRSSVHRNRSSSNSSCKETVVSLNNTQYYSSGRSGAASGAPYQHHHHHSHHRGCRHLSKNFNAFLSAIERVHQKDPRSTSTRLENLVEFAREKSKRGSKFLNNAMVDYCRQSMATTSHHGVGGYQGGSVHAQRMRHKSHLHLLNDKNVELICNNLNSRKSSLTESEEDIPSSPARSSSSSTPGSSTPSSNTSSSTNSSSEDNESEVGASSSSSTCSSSETEELSREEVRYLTQYVSGFSVTKYDCAPDKCPECLAAYYDFLSACASPQSGYSSQDDGESDSATGPSSDEDEMLTAKTAISELCPVTVKSEGKVEISVAKLFKKTVRSSRLTHGNQGRRRLRRAPPNGVYVDLEDSDVSLSVEYPMDTRSNRSSNRYYYYNTNSYHDNDNDDRGGDDDNNCDSCRHSNGPGGLLDNHHHHHHYHHSCNTTTTSPQSSSPIHHSNHNDNHHSNHNHMTSTTSSSCQQQQQPVPSFWDWFYYPLGSYGWLPYSLPYCLVPMYYLPYQLYSTIPKPIMVPRDTPCLNSQRLCYVPAQEIKNFTASQPPQRPWIPLSHPERNKPIALYTVMCYNVLCDKYATRQLYGYCPSWALNWEYRKKGIIEEIRHYSADIISLQEVETDQFYNFFLPELKRDGYDGIFSPKSRARTMTESERKHVDGCAIFYRTAKFSLIKEHLVEFNQLAMTTADGSHDMLNRVMTKDNIGLAALFETKEAIWENGLPQEGSINQPILVATCHVHWDPEFSDVKLIQTMMLMKELKNIVDETQTSFRPGSNTAPDVNNIPIILCGDLNSLPNSGVLEFLTTSRVAATHVDFKDLGYDACLQKLTTSENNKEVYTHSFKLAAAYSKDMIPYTNYTYDFKGVIDYIFYSRDLMRPLGVLGPLDENWFTENKVMGCPHPHIPSDHLPLLVEIEMQVAPPSVASMASGAGTNQQQRSTPSIHSLSGGGGMRR